MHIPDGYLGPATAGTLYGAVLPFWYFASRKLRRVFTGRLVPTMALMSAFCFVIQMINVPLPGDTTTGKDYGVVTFTFRTGAAGTYYFQCFDPCGTGTNGWEGPMTTGGYMRGTLTVQ